MNNTSTKTANRSPSTFRILGRAGNGYSLILWATLALLTVTLTSGVLTVASLLSLLPFASILAVAAAGQMVVVQQRGLDFSVAGIFSLSTIIVTVIPSWLGIGVAASIVIALLVAALIGCATGVVVTRFGITPLIATLGVNALLLGVCHSISGGSPTRVPEPLTAFASARPLGIPATLFVAVLFIGTAAWLIRRSTFGKRTTLVGANPLTSRASGFPVQRYQIGSYILAAICYCAAGILFAGYVGTPPTDSGNAYLLASVTAVVLGGTPLTGGRASIVATAIGALFITCLGQAVLAMGAPPSVQLLVQGTAIAVAMTLRVIPFYKLKKPQPTQT
ncbi:ABC transporter permease [Arthrobacter sp. StoSoilB20]|uniref:ABC transporter permease n=1 Tax=Arthrobacter sp. StoSoilB20 TaxID=2830995 RepID=UPI001CC39CFD|nr:ABC transporter permease [Arthrobacter sp. StoSoilB20]BCW58580.1 ribose ABC transporter permease [Arthrobacter sp. StoSoilB20]